jgi:hypothetical protein
LRGKITEVLEGGDEFAFGGIEGNVFDGVANGEHGLVVEEVGDIGSGEDDSVGEFGGAALRRGRHRLVFFSFKVRLKEALKLPARVFLM